MRTRNRISRTPLLIGSTVIIGHLIPFQNEVSDYLSTWGGEVTTKPITALCIIVASLIPSVIRSVEPRHRYELGLFLAVTIVTGFVNVDKPTVQAQTVGYNVPSWGTAVMFITLILGCCFPKLYRPAGWVTVAICLAALYGHIAGIPALYYYVESVSTAMARPTLAAGMLLGLAAIRARVPRRRLR